MTSAASMFGPNLDLCCSVHEDDIQYPWFTAVLVMSFVSFLRRHLLEFMYPSLEV